MILRLASRVAPIAIAIALAACASPEAAAPATAAHWAYDGDEGPAHWASLDPAYATCGSGRAQSPIDVPTRAPLGHIQPPVVRWSPLPIVVRNTGHVIQVDAAGAGSSLVFEGTTYELQNVHFHTPAEHTVDGRRYDAEIDLVHASPDGKKLVVALIVERGHANDLLRALVDGIPSRMHIDAYDTGRALDVAGLLPAAPTWLVYPGSLTAPPCTEPVTWLVVPPDDRDPLKMSDGQIGRIKSATRGATARPIQPPNGRFVRQIAP